MLSILCGHFVRKIYSAYAVSTLQNPPLYIPLGHKMV